MCIANQYKRTAGSDSCTVCPAGYGMPGGSDGNHDDCIPCSGLKASSDGIECKTCPAGQLPNDDNSACEIAYVYTDANEEVAGAAKAVTTVFATSSKGLHGYDTYRVALKLTAEDALNVFSIYGSNDKGGNHAMQIPPAKQVESGSIMEVGGVNPSQFSDFPDSKYGESPRIKLAERASQRSVFCC